MAENRPEISIVIGSQQACQTIMACLNAVTAQARLLKAEIIVADGSTDGTADIIANYFPEVELIRGDGEQLIPALWGMGMARAQAPLIAITTAQCVPMAGWLPAMIEAVGIQQHCLGVGGAIDGPCAATLMDWAAYFSRYSAYMPPVTSGLVAEIPGDNAVYRRPVLERYWGRQDQGFWETVVHHRLRAEGEKLYLSSDIRVRLGATSRPWEFARSRFRHGRHFSSTRPGMSTGGRVIRLLAVPALLPFLLLRIGRRVVRHRPDWALTFCLAFPWLIYFVGAWSLGELIGYIAPQHGITPDAYRG